MFFSCICLGLGASCGSPQCCVLNALQFVNAGQGCKRRLYGRDILENLCHDCIVGNHECLPLFTPSCCGECLKNYFRGLCACTEMV